MFLSRLFIRPCHFKREPLSLDNCVPGLSVWFFMVSVRFVQADFSCPEEKKGENCRKPGVALMRQEWASALPLMVGLLIRSRVVGLDTQDPVSYVAAVVLLVVIALFAILIPASRALRIDPAPGSRWGAVQVCPRISVHSRKDIRIRKKSAAVSVRRG